MNKSRKTLLCWFMIFSMVFVLFSQSAIGIVKAESKNADSLKNFVSLDSSAVSVNKGGSTSTITPTPTTGSVNIKIGDATGSAGNQVEVPIYLYNVPNTGLSTGIFNIKYKTEKLKILGVKGGPVVSDKNDSFSCAQKDFGVQLMFSDRVAIKQDGVFCILSCAISEEISDSSIDLIPESKNFFYDEDVKKLPTPTFTEGKITIEVSTHTSVKATPIPTKTPTPTKKSTNTKDATMVFSVSNIQGKPGEEVEAGVYIDNVPQNGLSSFILDIRYNVDYLSFVSVEEGDIVFSENDIDVNQQKFGLKVLYCANYSDIEKGYYIKNDGLFLKIKLRLKSNVALDTQEISISSVYKFYGTNNIALKTLKFIPGKVFFTYPDEINTNIEVDSVSGMPGDMVSIPVYFSGTNIDRITKADFNIMYDTKSLIYDSVIAGPIIGNDGKMLNVSEMNDGINVSFYFDDKLGRIKRNGVFCVLNFKIAKDCEYKELSLKPNTVSGFYGENGNVLKVPSFIQGKVTVAETVFTPTPTKRPTFTPTPTKSLTVTPNPTKKANLPGGSALTPMPTNIGGNNYSNSSGSAFTPTPTTKFEPLDNYSESINMNIGNVVGNAGDTVRLPLYIKNVPQSGLYSCIIDIDYDKNKLLYKSYKAGPIIYCANGDISIDQTSTGLKFMYCPILNGEDVWIREDGVMATIEFTIAGDCTDKEIILTPSIKYNFYDKDLKTLPRPVLTSGKIKLGLICGDINNDGAVMANDYAMLRDYIIGKLDKLDCPTEVMDAYPDGQIKANDIAVIRDYVIGKIKKMPVEIKK